MNEEEKAKKAHQEQAAKGLLLRRKAELLWKLVTTTAGVADLAEPMKRAEFHFERLTKRQRVTVAMIAKQFDEGCHAIDQTQQETGPIIPDEVIPPTESTEGQEG